MGSAVMGPIVGLILIAPLFISLIGVWRTQPGSAAVPSLFATGVLICCFLALFQGEREHGTVSWRHFALVVGLVIYGFGLWSRVPYVVATTLLIILCFVVTGRRTWPLMIGVWAGAQVLAYGVFKALLGIPIH
jgi:Tripartite tricarboxylate transporter TctB family